MVLHGPPGQTELFGHRAVGAPASDESEDLHLALGQPRRPFSAPAPDLVPRRAEDGLHRLSIKVTSADLAAQLIGGLLGRTRRPVGPRLDHRVIDVRGSQDAGSDR